MGPIGTAGYVFVASALVFAFLFGALGGTIGWAFRLRLLWAGLAAAAGYLAVMVPTFGVRPETVAVMGIPPLTLTLLVSWLTARDAETRARLHHLFATLVGLVCAIIAGTLVLYLFRLSAWAPVRMSLAADVFLAVLFYRPRTGPLVMRQGSWNA